MDSNDIAVERDGITVVVRDTDLRWSTPAMVQRIKTDLLALARGYGAPLPATVPDFSTLHDYLDANCLGGLCDDTAPRGSWDDGVDSLEVAAAAEAHIDRINAAQDEVDRWLKTGGLIRELGAVQITVRLTFLPTDDTGDLDLTDVEASLEARLDEVYVGVHNFPVTPLIEWVD